MWLNSTSTGRRIQALLLKNNDASIAKMCVCNATNYQGTVTLPDPLLQT